MSDRFDAVEFEENSEEIAQNIENTLDRVVNDYSEHWKGVIGEWIQNSYDGWCHNRFGRNVIPEDQELHIKMEVDLVKRLFKASDNAGGMPEETFYHNFAGLDTPGEEKQGGEFGGSYGRGSHVISGVGESMYAETHHDGFRGGLGVKASRQLRTDPKLNFEEQGTVVEVQDCKSDTIVELTDWDRVRRYIQARFNPLLQHDNVTVEYVIDGESRVVEPLDISDFDVLWEGDVEFTYGGTDYTLHDVVIYDATSSSKEVPISGVSMLKSNGHMDKPFMRVQDYRPRQLRHLDKMFGFCDASELCPKYEDNAHNSFTGNIISETGLKGLLEDLEREHFIGTPTDLDARDEIVNTTLEVVNSQWDHNPFGKGTEADTDLEDTETKDEDETDSTTEPSEVETTPTEDSDPDELTDPDDATDDDETDDIGEIDVDWADDEENDEEEEEQDEDDDEDDDDVVEEEDPEPELSCSTRQRSFKENDEVNIWVFIDNPSTYTGEDFTVSAQLEHDETGELVELDEIDMTVPPGKGSTGDHNWSVTPEKTGKYLFRAYLHDNQETPREKLDSTHTWFWVGRDSTEEEQQVGTVSFLEDVVLIRSDEEDFRAELNEGERGMILVANTRHPEYKHSVRLDGRTGTKNQKLALIRWAHESIMTRLLLDQLDDELADLYTDDGEPLAEQLGGFVRSNMIEQLSSLMAGAHEEL